MQGVTFDELWRTLTLQAGHNAAIVVLGATLLGVAGGVVGSFIVLRKRALLGDALSHAALPGIAGAFIAATLLGVQGRSLGVLLPGAAVGCVAGVLAVQAIVRWTRLRDDAAIAAVLSVFFGAGVVLLSVIQSMPTGDQGGLASFIYGQTAAMNARDAMLIGVAALGSIAAAALLFKEFRLACFDREFAAVQGWPVGAIDLAMTALLVVVTVIGLQAVGLLLIVALLIVPAAAARFWTERLRVMVPLSGALGGLSAYAGSCISALLTNAPAGAIIVLTAGAIFAAGMLFAPSRGVVAAVLRLASLRVRIAVDHALRAAHERAEGTGTPPPGRGIALALRVGGLARIADDRVELTPRGEERARRVVRAHRLWEQYLIEYADAAPSHVDVSADEVEHALPPALIAELEDALRRRWLRVTKGAPASPHTLGGEHQGGAT
ncbi:MAG TPA: iron chelate uptake ABC transporter family permease subunit [Phycisphaerales bacterium]|nr:iron chelate uptake ABC transporter family permease subunit [Phycisphaerales bacterium]